MILSYTYPKVREQFISAYGHLIYAHRRIFILIEQSCPSLNSEKCVAFVDVIAPMHQSPKLGDVMHKLKQLVDFKD